MQLPTELTRATPNTKILSSSNVPRHPYGHSTTLTDAAERNLGV